MALRDVVVYKRWDDGFVVRSMTHDDAKIVQKWYNAICPTSTDLDIALDVCDPSGKFFFIGELNGEVIASVANVPVCDEGLLYCSYFYVDERYRKFGYGRRINDEVADAAVGDAMLAMDAHDELEEMQKRRGCRSAFRVTLYQGTVDLVGGGSRSGATVEQLNKSLLAPLLSYDDLCYIRPASQLRRRLLEKWTKIPGGKTVVALKGGGDGRDEEVLGYGCRRPSFQPGNHLIGPLYADTYDVAWDIVTALTSDIAGQKIWINICEPNEDAVNLIKKLHLKDDIHMIRMHKNGDPGQISSRVFAITSIDICGF